MLEFKNKFVTYLVNFFLAIWQFPQVLIAIILLAILYNAELYRNEHAGITVIKVNKKSMFGNACFSLGPVIFVSQNSYEAIYKHESGHSKQSLYLGPLYLLVVAIPSVILFWYTKLKNKDLAFYNSHYPENWANAEGGVDTSIYGL